MEKIPKNLVSWQFCLSPLKLETHHFYTWNYSVPLKCWFKWRVEYFSDTTSCAYNILPRHSFCKGLQLVLKQLGIFLKRKAIAYSTYPWYAKAQHFAISKTKKTEGWRWDPEPWGRGFFWPPGSSSSIWPKGAGPSVAHVQAALETKARFTESWPEEDI